MPTGELELTLLGHEAPGGLRAYTRAHALAGALSLRADRDPDFARSIDRWYADARRIGMGGEAGARGSEADGRGCCGEGGGAGGGGCAGLAGGGGVIVLGEGIDGPFRVGPSGYSPGPAQGATGGVEAEAGDAWADGAVGEGAGEGHVGGDEGAGAEEDDGGAAAR
ncbi:hypothetical protein OG948_27765 [Embleya sp. NBC_00888]|uniref:hypothetical protein n=1 Tax=Embleya sp. NBC_00888 TaxID=2975960 RepID=UPI0038630F1C|nr:hypothetical protein OG948_27765 [Embleya sp. NBC_00888]